MNRPSKTKHRKAGHLSICINPHEYAVEHGETGFGDLRFVHNALPELDSSVVDTTESFLGYTLAAPLFISCMTGGSGDGFRANRNLAVSAQTVGIPVGMGSIRVLFEHEEVFDHFHLKKFAPDVPVLANIGGAQARDYPADALIELVKRLESDALVVHLNPGQELFQPGGDRDFRSIRGAIGELCRRSPLPIIVKETGFGVSPALVRDLLEMGVSYVDVAGAGGTNWAIVEAYRAGAESMRDAEQFSRWGIPTAYLLSALRRICGNVCDGRILASGGLRSGGDAAKAIALGAKLAGAALPLIRAEVDGGVEAVVSVLEGMIRVLRTVMILTGSPSVPALRRVPLWSSSGFDAASSSLAATARPAPGESSTAVESSSSDERNA